MKAIATAMPSVFLMIVLMGGVILCSIHLAAWRLFLGLVVVITVSYSHG
jgi:hypothetical protein